jgi:hypothetical protein
LLSPPGQATPLTITQFLSYILQGIGVILRALPPLFDLFQRLRRAVKASVTAGGQPLKTSINFLESPVKFMFIDHR